LGTIEDLKKKRKMPTSNIEIAVQTPLVFSKYLTDIISHPVYLKLENTQPSGSFKMRGISALCQKVLN